MNSTLRALSEHETKLYNAAVSATGTMEQCEQQLRGKGIFDEYKRIHGQYLTLFDETFEPIVKLEALKRLIFLNWYHVVEPSCLTGIGEFEEVTLYSSFERLNTYIIQCKLDHELQWMLSYYSCWDWILLAYAEPYLVELTAFIKSVDTSISHSEQNQPAAMDNRGQMGIYWQSHSIGR
ncbi:hypothetical protein [Hymenobacter sp.]|uniref:hypothetical protein n=1 Tax=Hymenobacter sp. TaxID=1898978 RepID=UPI00286A5542|nr:hypothetical protein [Hymenobacter sp.]